MRLYRLRMGEIVAAASAVLLLVFMFVLPWYAVKQGSGVSTSLNGWHSLATTRWLLVLTLAAAIALACFQVSRRSPAIPVTLSVIVTVLALLSSLVLIYKVLINFPGSDQLVDARVGAYLGLLSAIGITYGGFTSMRREGISPRDAPAQIETVGPPGTGRS